MLTDETDDGERRDRCQEDKKGIAIVPGLRLPGARRPCIRHDAHPAFQSVIP
jgi:hypothetical protein